MKVTVGYHRTPRRTDTYESDGHTITSVGLDIACTCGWSMRGATEHNVKSLVRMHKRTGHLDIYKETRNG